MLDKMTNGYIKIDDANEVALVKHQLIHDYRTLCKKEYDVDAKVKVKIEPIELSKDHIFTHRYSVRCTEK